MSKQVSGKKRKRVETSEEEEDVEESLEQESKDSQSQEEASSDQDEESEEEVNQTNQEVISKPANLKTFAEVGLAPWLIRNIGEVGIERPTDIQHDTLKHSLLGRNLIGCAHTGSGKTACFALPILQKLAKDPYGIFALIITPTRELAYQINEQFKTFAG